MFLTYHRVLAWRDYFSTAPDTILDPQKYQAQQTVNTNSEYIANCFFQGCTGEKGGAVFVSTSVSKLLIEDTTFSECKATALAGAVYYYANNGAVISKTCFYKCNAQSSAPTCHIFIAKSNFVDKNYVKDCSASLTDSFYADYEIWLQYGEMLAESINSTNNKCSSYSGITMFQMNGADFSKCSLKFSCMEQNDDHRYVCIVYFGGQNAKYEMKNCNVIGNTQIEDNKATVHAEANLNIYNSIIVNNSCKYSISVYSGTINVYNSYYDKARNGNIGADKATFFNNQLEFIETAGAKNPKKDEPAKKHTLKNNKFSKGFVITFAMCFCCYSI